VKRVILLIFDSFGLGASKDAKDFGDVGADTFGHIVEHAEKSNADISGVRQGPLEIPHLLKLGLAHAAFDSTGKKHPSLDYDTTLKGMYGYAVEKSAGKDTPSGHWEIAGLPVLSPWGYFTNQTPCFPKKLIHDFETQTKIPGCLGLCHASGTTIIEELGETHLRTGKPIVYTSGDSVFQVAAHEESFGLTRLYSICETARQLVDEYNVGRVIARPFIGTPGNFTRTGNRRDYTTPPPSPTLLDHLCRQGGEVISIGKISDIFAHQGISQSIKATGHDALFEETLRAMDSPHPKQLIFTNFVDFDMVYGHRRNLPGYAHALEALDKRLPELHQKLTPDDLVIISADHGCDPSWPGSDHTREHIPVLAFGPNIPTKNIGERSTFADIGQSIASYLEIDPLDCGTSFF
jgi:phosphopentomutase